MRVCLCSLYEKNCYLTKDVEFLLTSLKKISEHLIIIINGTLIDKLGALKLADKVLYRENKGFDGGAYKYALKQPCIKELIDKADELVLCNNTFYGPFVPFEKLFLQMAQNPCDFWGINLADNGIFCHIQSFFLVFRKTILDTKCLYDFFEKTVDENTLDFNNVLLNFEQGISTFLLKQNFTLDTCCKQIHHILSNPAGSIIYDAVPLLKRKAFDPRYFNKDSILDALCYIQKSFDYNIDFILQDIKTRHNVIIKKEDFINRPLTNVCKDKLPRTISTWQDIANFANINKHIFIYGAGMIAKHICNKMLSPPSVAGFIVSSKQDAGGTYMGKSIFCIKDFAQKQDTPIIVALSAQNTAQVRPLLKDFSNVLYLW